MQLINNKNFKGFTHLGLVFITLLLVLFFRNPAVAGGARHYTELEFPPLPEIQLPEYERYQLPNGMIVYLMEDHELPLVSGSAIIRTGSRFEPPDKVGLAELTGIVMRSGGTLQHPAAELNAMLEQRAAIVETGIDVTSGNAGFNTLSQDLPTVFNLFAEVLRDPAFTEEQLMLAKTQLEGQIARRNDDPGDIASREFRKLIYGNTSPYARTVEYTTLDNISRQNLVDFYQTYFHPNQMILGIVGDFEPTQMKALITDAFADWENVSPTQNLEIPSAFQENLKGIFFVAQPQLTQSNILLGHLGGKLDDPDYPALSVLNGVMNGFGGRLFKEVRSRQGLAYSVYGFWSPSYDYPGLFIAGGQTRSDATVAFVESILAEIDKLRTDEITPEELVYAKESILNSFVFQFEDPSQTLSRLMRYEYFDYPSDFIFQYQRGVKATTEPEILRVAQTHLNPEQIVTLVVGNINDIQPPLTNLGTDVEELMIDNE